MMTVASVRSKLFNEKRVEESNKLLLALCILFGLSSSLQKFGVFDIMNKGIIGLLCLITLALFCQRPQPKTSFLILSMTAMLHAIAFAFPVSSKEGIATYFMFAFWVLFWLYVLCNVGDFIKVAYRSRRFLWRVLTLWTAVTTVSFFLPMCYKLGWGGTRYFTSFTTDSFEVAPVALFMLSLNILLYTFDRNKVKALLFSIVPLACVFAAGTRTYLVVVAVEFIILLRLMVRSRGAFAALFTVCVVCFVGIAAISNIGQKFESATLDTASDMSVFLEVFTNGRSEFWAVDMEAFLASDWFTMLFGHGFSYVYELNQSAIGMRLYAHNDFINLLLNFGIVGLSVYFAVFVPVLAKLKSKCGLLVCLLFGFMWLFNAFFNMLYVYVIAVIGMGVIAMALLFADVVSDEREEVVSS